MTSQMGDEELHFWITRSVARVMGISFSDAISNGHISTQDYADMVTNCRMCARVKNCQRWLAEQCDLSHTAPAGCCNSKALETLARPH
ncbi:DUF6455 family protein [Marivita hallyeonensis]|uniref:DUF6455 domain-containing protein n=1 Tax=Marivita hallyeonensis TaxID=996342 RepID=A0A1M5UK43_9RHOB|nr:DUF6455 family protein [Marivita hallyeonensis]SHH63404.1 hypothetical protein SAMN05443551_2684 [Marivita hallyeonensis]